MRIRTPAGLALGLGLLLLAGCGGDTPADPVETADTLPDSAYASSEAFTRTVAMLPEDDLREPLRLVDTPPPTSETDEPAAVAR